MRLCCPPCSPEDDLDLVAGEHDFLDAADLHAGNTDRGAGFRPATFGNCLQRVALPEEPSAPGGEDQRSGDDDGDDRQIPIFSSDQASERVRGMSIVDELSRRNVWMYGSVDAREARRHRLRRR